MADRHAQHDERRLLRPWPEQQHKTETSFSADHPEIFASEDNGITPIEYVLVGLASHLIAGVAAGWESRHSAALGRIKTRRQDGHPRDLGVDSDVRNGYDDIKVTFKIDADASKKEIEAIVAQRRSGRQYDVLANPVNITVEVA